MSEQDTALTEAAQAQAFEELFTTAQACFKEFVEVLRCYGIETDPNMKLHRSNGMNLNRHVFADC